MIEQWHARPSEIAPGFAVARALPVRARRTVGPWCFLDRMGPVDVNVGGGLEVGPHPHIGLQTVTWLFEGAVVHRDSLGTEQRVEPGNLNLMTAGDVGVVHSERSPEDAPARVHGVQLWTALPPGDGTRPAGFEHHPALPRRSAEGVELTVFLGRLDHLASPATAPSPCFGSELRLEPGRSIDLEVDPTFECAVFLVDGDLAGDVAPQGPDGMAWRGPGHGRLALRTRTGARAILIGGEPLPGRLHMWWNYVAHDRQPIREAAADWKARRRFDEVPGDPGPRVEGPDLPDAY